MLEAISKKCKVESVMSECDTAKLERAYSCLAPENFSLHYSNTKIIPMSDSYRYDNIHI